MRQNLIAAAFGGLLLCSTAAWADPIFTPSGPLFLHFTGVEQLAPLGTGFLANSGTTGSDCVGCVPATGVENNWGVGTVDQLNQGSVQVPNESISSTKTVIFDGTHNNPGGTAAITFMFSGIHVDNFAVQPTLGSGGVISLYYWNNNSVSQTSLEAEGAGGRTASDQYSNVTCSAAVTNGATGCTLLATLDFVPGANDDGVTVDTLHTVSSPTNPITKTGQATFYAEVDKTAGGLWANALAGQYFSLNQDGLTMPDVADFLSADTFANCSKGTGAACGKWGNNLSTFGDAISDPGQADAIPEPSSLALLGISVLGLGGVVGWRRRRRTDIAA